MASERERSAFAAYLPEKTVKTGGRCCLVFFVVKFTLLTAVESRNRRRSRGREPVRRLDPWRIASERERSAEGLRRETTREVVSPASALFVQGSGLTGEADQRGSAGGDRAKLRAGLDRGYAPQPPS